MATIVLNIAEWIGIAPKSSQSTAKKKEELLDEYREAVRRNTEAIDNLEKVLRESPSDRFIKAIRG